MKKIVLSVLVAAAAGISAFQIATPGTTQGTVIAASSSASEFDTYKVAMAESKITWIGRKVTGEHNGNISLASGTMLFDRNMLRGGTFVMDMASITCNDLQGGSKDKLVNHLRSDDFFSVAKHPNAVFAITNLAQRPNAKAGASNYTITGNLTIKGISHEISFPALVTMKKGVVNAKANLKFDRTKWDIKYRSGNFVENLGDKAILDDIELQLELVAKEEVVAKKGKAEKKEKVAKS